MGFVGAGLGGREERNLIDDEIGAARVIGMFVDLVYRMRPRNNSNGSLGRRLGRTIGFSLFAFHVMLQLSLMCFFIL